MSKRVSSRHKELMGKDAIVSYSITRANQNLKLETKTGKYKGRIIDTIQAGDQIYLGVRAGYSIDPRIEDQWHKIEEVEIMN